MTQFRRIIILLLMACWCGVSSAQEGVVQRLPGENAELFALDQESLWNLTSLVRAASREVSALFRSEAAPPRRKVSFYALERAFSEEEFRGDDVAVSVHESTQRSLWRVTRALVMRELRERLGDRRLKEPAFVKVVSAGLVNRMLYGGVISRGFYLRDFRIPRLQFQERRYPSLRGLLEMPAPSDRIAVFRIYMVHSNLLLDILDLSTSDLPSLLERWCRGEVLASLPTAAALEEALPPGTLAPGEKLQSWYERRAFAVANDRPRENTPETIRQELDELLTVSFLSADSQNGILRVQLEQVPSMLRDYKLDEGAIAEIQMGLIKLQRSSPVLLQEAIGGFIDAVDAFRQKDFRTFRSRLAEARKALEVASGRQRMAERLLDEAEAADVERQRLQEWESLAGQRPDQ